MTTLHLDPLLIEILGVGLGVVALVVGLIHVREIRHALHNLADVQSSISTRYLGKFPRFLGDIVDVVNSADVSLFVFSDYPGYGEYSDPGRALDYQQALARRRALKPNFILEFTCLNADIRKRNIADQFSVEEWSNWTEDESKRELMLRFLKANANLEDPRKATIPQMIDALHAVDERLLREPYLASARQTALHMPIYFWIADGRKAVFSIPTLAHGAFEHGFVTSDHALIQALLEMYELSSARSAFEPGAGAGTEVADC